MKAPTSVSLAAILVLGLSAQWAAARLGIPSILLLLAFGLAAGPATGFLDPDRLFGELLLPLVSLAVAVILFEGGLSLKFRELRQVGGVLLLLITAGAAVTWLISAAAAAWLLGLDWPVALLLGALLTVTGPTVVGPLLRHIRPSGAVASILKWEGIVIDPVGALLAVLVFQAVQIGEPDAAAPAVLIAAAKAAGVGTAAGLAGAWLLAAALRRFLVPDHLHSPAALGTAVAAFTAANLVEHESGLVAVTVMGVALANRRDVTVRHMVEFTENLAVLLISCLFIVLAARLKLSDLTGLGWPALAFPAVLILVARPAAVWVSTLGSPLSWAERLFLAWMAPRGIVAAAVASVFALELSERGHPQAGMLVPVTFAVILATVSLYGLTAGPLARRLGLAHPDPQGVLFVGAHAWARALAAALRDAGVPVLLADSNRENTSAARMAGLPVYYGSVLSEQAVAELDLAGLGRMAALTGNDEVNSLACLRFAEVFGRREVYQLAFGEQAGEGRRQAVSPEQRGRLLFGPHVTAAELDARVGRTPTVRTTRLTAEFDAAFDALHGESAVRVFLLRPDRKVLPFTAEDPPKPQPGDTLISLVAPGPPTAA
jgi:NhaP-type Na+/H+ or K+/H+ antiporter